MKNNEINLEIACLIEQQMRKLEGDIIQLRKKRDEFHKLYEEGENKNVL